MCKAPVVLFKGKNPCDSESCGFCVLKAASTSLTVHRQSAKIVTGLEVQVPDGYQLCFQLADNLVGKGLVCTSPTFLSGKVDVAITNCGREIVSINLDDVVGKCWLQPVIEATWKEEA